MMDPASLRTLLYVLAAAILFPLLIVGLTEAISRVRRLGRTYATSLVLLRSVVLPLAAIYVLVVYVGRTPQDALISKLAVTALVIIGLVAGIGVLNGLLFEREAGTSVPKLFLDLVRILIVAIGIAVVLSLVWGYDLNNLITALGVSSIVLGLALQDTLGNLFNGITLINERPFSVGDFIEVDGHVGRVVEVNWRATRLLTRERDLIVLPHMTVAQSAILNHSVPEEHWAQKLMLGFSYSAPPNHVKKVMLETLYATPGILHDPVPEVKVDSFDDSAVTYEVEYYIASYGRNEEIKDEFMTRVWYAARRENIEIPFPQLNLHREPQQELRALDDQRFREDLELAVGLLHLEQEYDRLKQDEGLREFDYGRGETLMTAGTEMPGLFFIVAGRVHLQATDADGDTVELSDLGPGDLLTEVIPRGRRTNSLTAVAMTDVRVLQFGDDLIRLLVNRYPKLANQITAVQTTRRKQAGKVVG